MFAVGIVTWIQSAGFGYFFNYYSETLLIVKMGASLEKYIVDVC